MLSHDFQVPQKNLWSHENLLLSKKVIPLYSKSFDISLNQTIFSIQSLHTVVLPSSLNGTRKPRASYIKLGVYSRLPLGGDSLFNVTSFVFRQIFKNFFTLRIAMKEHSTWHFLYRSIHCLKIFLIFPVSSLWWLNKVCSKDSRIS